MAIFKFATCLFTRGYTVDVQCQRLGGLSFSALGPFLQATVLQNLMVLCLKSPCGIPTYGHQTKLFDVYYIEKYREYDDHWLVVSTYSEKYEFASWDYSFQYMEKQKMFQTPNQIRWSVFVNPIWGIPSSNEPRFGEPPSHHGCFNTKMV